MKEWTLTVAGRQSNTFSSGKGRSQNRVYVIGGWLRAIRSGQPWVFRGQKVRRVGCVVAKLGIRGLNERRGVGCEKNE
mgnify:CR=1 FL=1